MPEHARPKLTCLFLLVALSAVSGYATCADLWNSRHSDEQVRKSLDRYQAIFKGEVVSSVQRNSFTQILRVKVIRIWKGPDDDEITLAYVAGDEEYGFPQIGSEETFYAVTEADGSLTVPHCGRSYGLQDARMQKLFGPGREKVAVQTAQPEEEKSLWTWIWEKIRSIFS